MPHRLNFIWQIISPVAWISALSGAVGVVTADGVAAAITVVGLAFAVALSKCAAPMAGAIREIGFAWADVRGRMRRELQVASAKADDASAKADDNATRLDELSRAKDEALAKAERVAAEAALAKREAADLRRQIESMRSENDRKRHDLADRLGGQLNATQADLADAQAEIARLNARIAEIDQTHVPAINTISQSVGVVASHMDPPIPVPTPHLAPSEDKSDSKHSIPAFKEPS
jgi:hypothetical protein